MSKTYKQMVERVGKSIQRAGDSEFYEFMMDSQNRFFQIMSANVKTRHNYEIYEPVVGELDFDLDKDGKFTVFNPKGYDSTLENVRHNYFPVQGGFETAPAMGSVIGRSVAPLNFKFAQNFGDVFSSVATPPAAAFVVIVLVNDNEVGIIQVDTAGQARGTTTSSNLSVLAGSVVTLVTATAITDAAGFAMTVQGIV